MTRVLLPCRKLYKYTCMLTDLFFNSVSAGETEKMIHEWDGLTRFLDSVMSRFFKVDNCQVSRHRSPSYMRLLIPGKHSYYTLNSLFLFWLTESYSEFSKSASDFITADYTIIMSRTLKVTGNHVMYDHGAWFLGVIMSSLCTLWCLPSVKEQKFDLFCFSAFSFGW